MIHVLLIIFIITLFYMAIANRLMTYIKVLALQGVLLFFVVFIMARGHWATLLVVFLVLGPYAVQGDFD